MTDNLGRRGQSAMEYLMTYGWAILAVMIVGIAMWQLGIFSAGGLTGTTSTGFPRIKPQLSLTKTTTAGDFQGIFTNGGGSSIIIQEVSGSCYFTHPVGRIPYGHNFEINGTGCNISGMGGDPYEVDLMIVYNISLGKITVQHNEYGSLRGPLE